MRKSRVIFSILFVLILLTGCISIPIGDGDSIKLSKDGVSVKSKDGDEMTMKADEDAGSFSIEGTDAEGDEVNFKSTSSEEIPADFPASIPIPDEAVVTFGGDQDTDEYRSLTVIYEVEGNDFEEYGDMYREYATDSGYETSLDSNYEDLTIQFLGVTDEERFGFAIEVKDETMTITVNHTIIFE